MPQPKRPRKSPRRLDDIESKLRELSPPKIRRFKPLTGIPATPDENGVYEFGRLITANFFGVLNKRDLDAAREELGIDTDEKERVANNVSIAYKYLEYQNRQDFDGIKSIHHNPYMNKTYFGRWPIDPEAHCRGLRGWFSIVPDASTEANKIVVAAGNKVVIRTTARGTQVGDFPNSMMGARGKQFAVALMHSIDIVDGRIASCEGISPFENQFDESFIASNFPGLGGDVSEVRARQGTDAGFEYLAAELVGGDTALKMYSGTQPLAGADVPQDDILGLIKELHDQAPMQCQSLIAPEMRRCAKIRPSEDSLYCRYHQEHGYGIDDL
jgi:hypothetical protein